MTVATHNRLTDFLSEEANGIRNAWGWLLAFGIVQIIVGIVAVNFAFSATIATVVMLGVLFLIAAGAQLAAVFFVRAGGSLFLFLFLGILYAVLGFLTINHPLLAAEGLTLMLAACFMIGGLFRIVTALVERFRSWGWVLINGVITMFLGVAIWQRWPESGLWVLGLFVGIDLIVNGMTWSILALSMRNALPKRA